MDAKRKFYKYLLLSCFICSIFSLFSCVSEEKEQEKIDETLIITIIGKVEIKGSEPHTYIAIVLDDGTEYAIVGDLEELIRSEYQNVIIELKGNIVSQAVGPGFPAKIEGLQLVSE